MYPSDYIENLYIGFCNTKLLWKYRFKGLNQLNLMDIPETQFNRQLLKKRRLGQLAEQFAFNQLEQLDDCKILAENLQIHKNKQTLGELDALIKLNQETIHLEIIYKFYVYDDTIGTSELEGWIGPNRKDSLIEKITKLKTKQLPLLYSSECESVLNALELDRTNIQQKVLFKAQLFIPYQKSIHFSQLNEDCVNGFYFKTSQLNDFDTCEFYIPEKLEWFLDVNDSVDWLSFENFKKDVETFLSESQSPLIWIKKTDGKLLKSFLVWW